VGASFASVQAFRGTILAVGRAKNDLRSRGTTPGPRGGARAESPGWVIGADDEGTRLDFWLSRRPELGTRGRAREAIRRGKILLNGETVGPGGSGYLLAAGDLVRHWSDRPGSSRPRSAALVARRSDLAVVMEDPGFLVLNKPPGLLVEPLPGEEGHEITLVDLVSDQLRFTPGRVARVVHRIDRDTSGLVLVATSIRMQAALKGQFERQTPLRLYLAVVHGRVEPDSGPWRDRIVWDRDRLVQKRAHPREERGRDAQASYRVLERFPSATLVEVRLATGKRNQIRYQAGVRGHPLVGERIYTFGAATEGAWPPFPRQALHAWRLGFVHPATGRPVTVEAALPGDMEALIGTLREAAPPAR